MPRLQILNIPFSCSSMVQDRSLLFRPGDDVVFAVFQKALFDFTETFDETCFRALRLTCQRAYVLLNPVFFFRTQLLQPSSILVERMKKVAEVGFPKERLFSEALSKIEKGYHALYTKADPEIYDPLIGWLRSLPPDSLKQISTLSIRFTTGGKTGNGGLEKPLEIIRLLPHISSITINDYESGAQCKLKDPVLSEIAMICYRLEHVILRGCKYFTHIGLASLIGKHASFLTTLDLHQCIQVNLEGEDLLQEVFFPRLAFLCLPYNVKKEGVLEVVSRSPRLQHLAIRSNSKLNKSDVEEILRASNLTTIDLSDSLKLEPIDIDELKANFPQITFNY